MVYILIDFVLSSTIILSQCVVCRHKKCSPILNFLDCILYLSFNPLSASKKLILDFLYAEVKEGQNIYKNGPWAVIPFSSSRGLTNMR